VRRIKHSELETTEDDDGAPKNMKLRLGGAGADKGLTKIKLSSRLKQ